MKNIFWEFPERYLEEESPNDRNIDIKISLDSPGYF